MCSQVSLIASGAAIGHAVNRYNLLQRLLLEGNLFLRVSSRLTDTHPLKIPFSPTGATSYVCHLFILSLSLLVWILHVSSSPYLFLSG